MILYGYGIELVRLQQEHLELVRTHRNAENVNRFMEFREHITEIMQQEWFQRINNRNNNYFLIRTAEKFVGLINGSEIDWQKKETRSGGIFIWEESYRNTDIPLRASLLLTDLSLVMGLERTYARILRDNFSAIAFNKQLGYILEPGQEEIYNQQYVLHKDAYLKKTARLRAYLNKKSPTPFRCVLTNVHDDSEQWIATHYKTLPTELKSQMQLEYSF